MQILFSNSLSLLLCSLVLISASCSRPQLPLEERLDNLRILALITEPPEADPSAQVEVTPVISDLFGKGRVLTFSAELCRLYDRNYLGSCTAIAKDQAVTGLKPPSFTGKVDPFHVVLPSAEIVFAFQSAQDQYNGVRFQVNYQLKSTDGSTLKAHKKIYVSNKPVAEKNHNPVIQSIDREGVALIIFPVQTGQLTPHFGQVSSESYTVMSKEGKLSSLVETLEVSWMASVGELGSFNTMESQSNSFTRSNMPSGLAQSAVLAAVVRDERGGMGVFILTP